MGNPVPGILVVVVVDSPLLHRLDIGPEQHKIIKKWNISSIINSFNTSNQTLNFVLLENRKSREKKNITTNDSESIKCINIAINTCVNRCYFEYE